MSIQKASNFLTVLLSGLIAGLLFGYYCSVNPGLKNLSDTEYIKAMQSINIAIQNPVFLVSFMGLLVTFPISSYLSYKESINSTFYLMVFAMLIYIVGAFGVTMIYNVPLNEQLAAFNLATSTSNEISVMRQAFEKPWNFYHNIRTVAAIVSFGLAIIAVNRRKI